MHEPLQNAEPAIPLATSLRRQAEALFREKAARSSATPEDTLSPEDMRIILHELRVHEIELELQNEELRRSQAEMDESRTRYFNLYNLAPVGYCTVSDQGLIQEANLTAATLLGLTRAGLLQQPISRFIFREDQDAYYLLGRQLIRTDESQSCELRMVKQDGTPFWVHLEASVQVENDASVLRIVLNDISGRKKTEAEKEKLETKNLQLQKSESLACMAGAIAHLFNNQLLAVTGNIELALSDLPSHTGTVEQLQIAMQAARKAAEVSSMMLTYIGQEVTELEALDLAEVSHQIVSLLRPFIPPCVVLDVDLPSPGPLIKANAKQIHQILNSLMTNAWEASGKEACVIRLSVGTVDSNAIPTSNRWPIDWQPQAPSYACLEVKDTGCGIAPQDILKIHDPFYSSKSAGRGLGLAMVLGIARADQGAVTVESEPGRGSTFRVYFPVAAETVASKPVDTPRIFKTAGSRTLLVVEDDQSIRNLVKHALKQFGYSVLTAGDGIEAVEVFRQHQTDIDCVLCDMTMPHMNGWETLTALRKLAPDIPVILSSGYSEALVMKGEQSEPPSAFLLKPYTLEDLRTMIGQVLANRKKPTTSLIGEATSRRSTSNGKANAGASRSTH